MAVVRRNVNNTLKIRVVTSVDAGGVPVTAYRNILHFNPAVTDSDAYLLGVDIGGMLQEEKDGYAIASQYELANE